MTREGDPSAAPAPPPREGRGVRFVGELALDFDDLARTLVRASAGARIDRRSRAPLRRLCGGRDGRPLLRSDVGRSGFRSGAAYLDDERERARRYGEVWTLEDSGPAYWVRLEFPRHLPPTSLAEHLDLPSDMPDYELELALDGGDFVVHARMDDPRVRKLAGIAPAFPSTFTTRIPLPGPVQGFVSRYREKVLDVLLPKVHGAAG